jgi:glutathione S-transferase
MYQLYIGNKNYSSWSLRPWVLMTALKIPFEEHLTRFEGNSSWAEFRKFSPTGKVPCLVDGDTTVWDSLGITEYVAESHSIVWPAEAKARAWARSAAAEMHSAFGALRTHCSMCCGIRLQLHQTPEALTQDIARLNELWNEGLKRFGGPFLAGPVFTAVDAFYAPVVFRVQTYGLKLDAGATAYADRMLALPAMRSWYEAAIAEDFRDDVHEVEILKSGKLITDFRAAVR